MMSEAYAMLVKIFWFNDWPFFSETLIKKSAHRKVSRFFNELLVKPQRVMNC